MRCFTKKSKRKWRYRCLIKNKVMLMKTEFAPTNLIVDIIVHPAFQRLANLGEIRNYKRNTVVIHEGDKTGGLFIVLTRRMRVFAMSDDNRPREITLSICGPGQCTGEMSLDGSKRSASIITLVPTQCVCVDASVVQEQLSISPDLAIAFMQQAFVRARHATQVTRHALFSDTYSRLTALLKRQNDPATSQGFAQVPTLTHAQMAQQIGCSREMVSRILKDLVLGGYVVRESDKTYQVRSQLPARW